MGKRVKERTEWRANSEYNSEFEETISNQLKEEGIEFEYEKDTIIYVQPAQTRKYTPDFFLPNGIIIETKGKWTVQDRKKMVLVLEQNPDLDIRMLFQFDNKLNKNAKTRYSEWAAKRGIPYAIGEIPQEWLEEVGAKPRKTEEAS